MCSGKNIIHASDAVDSAEREIALWFPNGVKNYASPLLGLLYE
jgi:nucleoside-diphosphate kinase